MVTEDDVGTRRLRAPLLGSEASKAEAPRWRLESGKHDEVGDVLGEGRAGLDILFARRLLRLLSVCRAWPAASFVLLALAESLLTSEGGRVVSGFVRTLVDNDMRAFGVQVGNAAAVYLATTVLHSFTKFLAGMLALSWRRQLTLKLHTQYCKHQSWYRVCGVDNPDQRIARDVAAWSEQLAKVLQEVAVVPFEVLLYTHLTLQVLGWWVPVAVAYGFFAAGMLVQRAIAAPIARLVFRRRQSEGAFRAAHMRLRFLREEVAFYGGSCAERHHLGKVLQDVLAKQAAVVRRSWLQDAVTKALDYQGSILNYVCIALAVWSGRVNAASDAGEMASIISKSSFYMLGLIYAFTRVINTADTVASLAGLTARVAQLQEELEAQEGASSGVRPAAGCLTHVQEEASAAQDVTLAMNALRAEVPPPAGVRAASRGKAAAGQSGGARSTDAAAAAAAAASEAKPPDVGSSELRVLPRGGERGRYAPDLGRHHEKHAAQATMLISPVALTLPTQEVMEVSVHSMGSGLLLEEVVAVFPTCPCGGSIVAVVTFQSAPPGVELDATSEDMCQKAGMYMDRMLEEFLWFEGAVRALLEVEGFWCNAVDPRTGRALHGPRGSRYSEVVGSEVLLGYPQDMCGPCPVVMHPRFGKSAYPATLFTNAPLPMLLRCFLTCNASPSSVLGADAESSCGRSDAGRSEASGSEPAEPEACGEDDGTEADDCSLGSQRPVGAPPPPPDVCYPMEALLGGRGSVAGSGEPMASVLSTMALAGRAQHCVSYSSDGRVGFAARLGLPQGAQLWTMSSMPLPSVPPARSPLPPAAGRPGRAAAHGVCSEPVLEVCGLTLALPHAMVVVRNCSFSVAAGDNILVSGPSGGGKTSLLRCLAGLQAPSSGTVKFSLHAKVMFVPQRPILAPGATLRHQLLYPDCLAPAAAPPVSSSPPDHYLQTLLHRVELPHLLQHSSASFGTCCDWTALSPGELQRLAFARVLHRQPTLVVMDEPTSALPPQQASRMLSLLTDAGISFLIASHDAHVEGATRFIQLFGDGSGSWSLV